MTDKLTRREKERIIFDWLKGKPNPLYDVEETCHGKYVVKPKQIQVEEEEEEEVKEVEPVKQTKPADEPKPTKQQLKRERRKQNRRAKQDAYRILEQLNRLINANNEEPVNDSSDDEPIDEQQAYRAAPLVEQPNFNNQKLSFKRKRLRF